MKFSKMHGIGNDFIMLDYVNYPPVEGNMNKIAKVLCDRNFGIGSDGVIIVSKSNKYDYKMTMYNSDGTLGAMCGNGARCVGKLLYDRGITKQEYINLETDAGLRTIRLNTKGGKIETVSVGMGVPRLDCKDIPANVDMDQCINKPVDIDGTTFNMTLVSMGNPHAVIFVDDVSKVDIETLGPMIQKSPVFPDSVNVEFIQLVDRNTIKMRVYERGSGETLACGTGSCAAAVASLLNGYTDTRVTVQLARGELVIDINDSEIVMTGTATHVFDGEIDLNKLELE